MKITVLMENTACRAGMETAHGLSVHLETGGRRILVDVGPEQEFLHNARTLGVDISAVDLCVISHGHYDHGGGLGAFLGANDHAPVYLSERAFAPCYHGEKYIGLDAGLQANPRIQRTGPRTEVAENLLLFSRVPGDTLVPAANAGLNGENGPDDFLHEQDMLLWEGDKLFLLGGCAHRGIVNILETARAIAGRWPDVVLSGFHLAAGGTGKCMADGAYLDALAEKLLATGAKFYTCHCTGPVALAELKARMGDRVEGVSAGTVLEF